MISGRSRLQTYEQFEYVLTLEHQHLEARARQIACGNQSVVSGPDDDGVEVRRRS